MPRRVQGHPIATTKAYDICLVDLDRRSRGAHPLHVLGLRTFRDADPWAAPRSPAAEECIAEGLDVGVIHGSRIQQIVDVVEVRLERVEPVPERPMGQQIGSRFLVQETGAAVVVRVGMGHHHRVNRCRR